VADPAALGAGPPAGRIHWASSSIKPGTSWPRLRLSLRIRPNTRYAGDASLDEAKPWVIER